MYVNPFERMRKKREDEEKAKLEAEKEREKYARLGAQMGLTQEKGVVPSFIKNLIGEQNNQNNPPFGMGISQDVSVEPINTNKSYSNNNTSNMVSPFGKNSFEGLNTEFTQTYQNLDNYNSKQFESTLSQDCSFNQQPNFMEQPKFNQQPNFMEQPNLGNEFSFKDIAKNFENTEETKKSTDIKTSKTILDDINRSEKNKKELKEVDEIIQIKHKSLLVNELLININDNKLKKQFYSVISSKKNKDFLLSEIVNEIDLDKVFEIDMEEIYLYSSPFLFLLKQIICGLPNIDLEDKRILWEKTSLFLVATEYAKTDSEVDEIIEEMDIFDPLGSIKEEFNQVLKSYSLIDKSFFIALNSFEKISQEQIFETLTFLHKLFRKVSSLKFIFSLNKDFLIELQENNKIHKLNSLIDYRVYQSTKQKELIEGNDLEEIYENQNVEKEKNDDLLLFPTEQKDFFQEKNNLNKDPSGLEQIIPNSNWAEANSNLEINQQNINNTIASPLGSMNPKINQEFLSQSSQVSSPPGGLQNFSNSFYNSYNDKFNFGFPTNLQIEEPTEEHDSGIDKSIRIRVDLNLKRKEQEIKEREKLEEIERLERQGGRVGFNPAILAENNNEDHNFKQSYRNDLNINRPGLIANPAVNDPRSYDEVQNRLQNMASTFASRPSIDVNDKNYAPGHKKDENFLKVTGDWSKLNK
ncbi:hypothetical protein SGLAD_v1c09800 [Spiroplasma gladiatoris]|uniref:Uncharacterized protein n=1 Tax=Spiroplasma gladiatoris TaxID=2143 RepID=A0A4V1AQE1_9MOLU|nr:hypothetical protein [Spiroplasma gladiatoris]QBQ08179.1 hypothetical protein SGLAD_v1c09800 [Spiroplasma gladiatoris]